MAEKTAYEAKHIHQTVKHGAGSVMIWGDMAIGGVGELAFINMTMTVEPTGYRPFPSRQWHQTCTLGCKGIAPLQCSKQTANILIISRSEPGLRLVRLFRE